MEKPFTKPPEHGTQPLDALLTELHITSHDLVKTSTEQLNHKMVAKGRKGRSLSRRVQIKILRALNKAQTEKQYKLEDLFNYKGK